MSTSSFNGDLGLVGLFDLGQLLMLNRATGCLAVISEGRKGYFYFREGRIINAVDEAFGEGQGAACRIFAWKTGRFEFTPEAPGGAPVIQVGTETLMLEAARLLDEAGQDNEAGSPGEALRLRTKRDAMEALRDAFSSLAHEARTAPAADAGLALVFSLGVLVEPGDRLLIRPGSPPRLRRHGAWEDAGGEVLSPEACATIRARLLGPPPAGSGPPVGAEVGRPGEDGSSPAAGPGETPVMCRRVALPSGRFAELAVIPEDGGETLLFRPVDLQPPDRGALSGPVERLEEVLRLERGLVIVGGADLPSRERLLAVLIDRLSDRRNGTILLVSPGHPWRHEDAAGMLIRVTPEALLRAIEAAEPSAVVFARVPPWPALLLETLDAAGLAVVPAIGRDPGPLITRCLAGLSAADPRGAEATLAEIPLALITALPDCGNAPGIGFEARLLDEEQRRLALSGETAALALSFDQPDGAVRRLGLHQRQLPGRA